MSYIFSILCVLLRINGTTTRRRLCGAGGGMVLVLFRFVISLRTWELLDTNFLLCTSKYFMQFETMENIPHNLVE